MKRRTVLTAAPLGLAGFLLACTALTPAAVQTQLQSDTAALAGALSTVPALLAAAGVTVPAGVTTQINNVLADINANAAAIASAATAPPNTVTTIVSDIKLVAGLVSPFFPAAAAVVPIIDAALSLGTVLLAGAGVSLAAAGPLPPPKYTPDQARLILRNAAGRRT